MDISSVVHASVLCIVNFLLMLAGIFLNSVVIISLGRSSQLRKKLCYFMILVLSCFDLAVVAVNHPILIISIILSCTGNFIGEFVAAAPLITIQLGGLSLFALLMLNLERFLAISYPFFHQSSVTKTRIKICFVFWIIVQVGMSPLLHFYEKTKNVLISVFAFLLLCAFIYSNYKILVIAKTKLQDERIERVGTYTSATSQRRKRGKKKLKNILTCSLAVGCFFVCSLPQIIFSVWRTTSNTPWYDRQALLLSFWCNTIVFMNSTLNCLIFFWKNSVLRREGMKTTKCFWSK